MKDNNRGTTLRPKSWLVYGGVIGPAAFVADWAVLGAGKPGYSPVRDAISRLAELGSSTRPQMTGGFIVYGAGLIGYGLALRQQLPGLAGVFAIGTGLATLGVAAFPLGTPTSGTVHAAFALLGYASLAAVPIAVSPSLLGGGHRAAGRASLVIGLAAGALLAASAAGGPVHGLTQRAGLTLGDAWVVASALALALRPQQVP